jgi:histidyl-tRNA synthetase
MVKTQPARGMRDFLPADVRRREYVIGIIKEVYERYGFEPLETPAVENIETLSGKYGEEGNQLIFDFVAVIGASERERGEVALKDMRTGEQRALPRERVAATVREMLKKS